MYKKWRATHSHIQESHKNTELEAIIDTHSTYGVKEREEKYINKLNY